MAEARAYPNPGHQRSGQRGSNIIYVRRKIASLAPLFFAAALAADFDRDIRPILSDDCYACHGPDETKRVANLRFDTPDGGAFSKRGSYQIIVPGDSRNSRLFQRVSAGNKAMRMPP